MRILLSFLQDVTNDPHPIPAYRFWPYYIKNGIEESGMQWTEIPGLDWAAGLVPYDGDPALQQWKQQAWDKTIRHIKANREQIDVFLCYLYPKQIDTGAIKQIQAMGIPCVNFYCDNVRSFTKVPAEFKVFDLMWVPEFEALDMYQKAGVAHINLPMPMWVDPRYRDVPEQEIDMISFIGSKDELRAALLADAIGKGLAIQIRGSGWDNMTSQPVSLPASTFSSKISNQVKLIRNSGIRNFAAYHFNRFSSPAAVSIPQEYIFGKPDFEEYTRLSREGYVTIGLNQVPTFNTFIKKHLTYSRLRDLEAPMLGACYITEYAAGLPHLYDLGTDIETFTTTDELVYKTRELAASKSRRRELRVNGQKRVISQNSIPTSMRKLKARLFK